MLAAVLALSSSLTWGVADFIGGLQSRRHPLLTVLVLSQGFALLLILVAIAAGAAIEHDTASTLWAAGSGALGVLGLMCFYRALAIGTMSIVAPIAATGVALPVLVGIATGDRPGLVRSVGLAAAVVGIVLASREGDGAALDPRLQRRSVGLAILAALGFGSYFVLAEIGSDGDVAWALALSRVSAAPLVAAIAVLALRRGGRRPRGREIATLCAIGLLDLGANASYNSATTIGELSTVSVGSSLYPVMTVFMAALVLGERVRGVQRAGVVVALGGVVLIALGA